MSTLHAANNFFESLRPWELKAGQSSTSSESSDNIKNTQKLETIIGMTMDTLRLCGIILQPIIPEISGKLLDKLGVSQNARSWTNLDESFLNKTIHRNIPEKPLGSSNAILFQRLILRQVDKDNRLEKVPTKRKSKEPKKMIKAQR